MACASGRVDPGCVRWKAPAGKGDGWFVKHRHGTDFRVCNNIEICTVRHGDSVK